MDNKVTQQNELTAEALRRGANPGPGYALARALSQIFHPVILSVVSVLVVGLLGVEPRMRGLAWGMLCIAIQVVPVMTFFTIRLRQGAYSDEDVSVRTQRNELYLFSMGSVIVGTFILALFHAPSPFLAMFVSAALINLLCFLINLFWKISVHSAGIGSCATLAALYSEPVGLVLWLCALALGWARVRTRNHTPAQVLGGLTLSCICVLLTFMAFRLL